MNNAELNFSLRKDRRNGIGKPRQTVNTGDEYIFDASVLKFCQNGQPVIGSFAFWKMNAQYFFFTVQVQAQ